MSRNRIAFVQMLDCLFVGVNLDTQNKASPQLCDRLMNKACLLLTPDTKETLPFEYLGELT